MVDRAYKPTLFETKSCYLHFAYPEDRTTLKKGVPIAEVWSTGHVWEIETIVKWSA